MEKEDKLFFTVTIIFAILLTFSITMAIGSERIDSFLFEDLEELVENSIKETNESILDRINITYVNLTKNETINFENIFINIKEDYLVGNNNWIITKNTSNYCENCNGQNRGKGREIIIKYRDDLTKIKRTICHELLHSFFITGNESHKLVYDIADYKTCFE